MRKLDVPSIAGEEKKIFSECAGDFTRKKEYMETALAYEEEVENCSKEYVNYVPYHIAGFPHINIGNKEKQIINKVYDQKFAQKNSIGRKYYDIIMGNARGRCPICGGGKPKNLDHFLPRSKYPLLCVTALNLIPTCRDCNMDKGVETSADYYEIPFHPYLEEMKDKWVECEVTFYPDKTFSIGFQNGYDKSKDPNLWKKYEEHMRITDLAATFSSRAEEELENVRGIYKKELSICGEPQLAHSLTEVRDSAEAMDVNSWKAALYRALLREQDKFCGWLKL